MSNNPFLPFQVGLGGDSAPPATTPAQQQLNAALRAGQQLASPNAVGAALGQALSSGTVRWLFQPWNGAAIAAAQGELGRSWYQAQYDTGQEGGLYRITNNSDSVLLITADTTALPSALQGVTPQAVVWPYTRAVVSIVGRTLSILTGLSNLSALNTLGDYASQPVPYPDLASMFILVESASDFSGSATLRDGWTRAYRPEDWTAGSGSAGAGLSGSPNTTITLTAATPSSTSSLLDCAGAKQVEFDAQFTLLNGTNVIAALIDGESGATVATQTLTAAGSFHLDWTPGGPTVQVKLTATGATGNNTILNPRVYVSMP